MLRQDIFSSLFYLKLITKQEFQLYEDKISSTTGIDNTKDHVTIGSNSKRDMHTSDVRTKDHKLRHFITTSYTEYGKSYSTVHTTGR